MTDGRPLPKTDLWEEYSTNLHGAYNAMRRAFKRSGMSQEEVALKLGADKGLTSKRLHGQANLTLRTLSFMASALGCRLTIGFVPYADIGTLEQSEGTQKSASLPPAVPTTENRTTADEPAYLKPPPLPMAA